MNSVRLGTYQTIDNYGYNRNTNGELNPGLCILWGGISGIFGSTVGCPLYMIKTQMQAQSYGKYAVGFQHGHKSTLDAFKRILAESGVRGNEKSIRVALPFLKKIHKILSSRVDFCVAILFAT